MNSKLKYLHYKPDSCFNWFTIVSNELDSDISYMFEFIQAECSQYQPIPKISVFRKIYFLNYNSSATLSKND